MDSKAKQCLIPYVTPLNHAVVDPQLATASVVLHLFPATATRTRNEVSWSSEWLAEACVHPLTNLRHRKSMFDQDVRQFHEQPTRYTCQPHLAVLLFGYAYSTRGPGRRRSDGVV